MKRVIIIGGGGHAQVVADILLRMQEYKAMVQPIGFLDDNLALHNKKILGLPILGTIAQLSAIPHDAVVVAIGDNHIRRLIFEKLSDQHERFVVSCHPSAIVAPDVYIGPGTMISAGAIINSGSTIGSNVILNTSCTVDHHNRIGNHSHLGPGTHLGGEVIIEEGVLLGIGATVLSRGHIGHDSVIGAGAVVIDHVPPATTVVGIPARPIIPKVPA